MGHWLSRGVLRDRFRHVGLLIAITLAGVPATLQAADAVPPVTYFRIASGSVASADFPVGEAIANLISKPPGAAPCEPGGRCGVPGLVASAETSAGALGDVRAVAAGRVDSALVPADVVDWAWRGTGPFAGEGPRRDLAVIATLHRASLHLVVRRGAGITRLRDLKGKRVSLGPANTLTAVEARLVLEAAGLRERNLVASHLEAGRAADALAAGRLDAFFLVDSWPAQVIADLAIRDTVDLLPLDGRVADSLRARNPLLAATVIPAGTYGSIPATPTLDIAIEWIIPAGAGDDLVYQLARALFDPVNRPVLQRAHPSMSGISPGMAPGLAGVPLHPGAARYYAQAPPGKP